ncbi:MAG: FAD-dependent oxidoreductase [Halobacteriales archaeon]|nr:FAD-dependent oxidoreductase [Halobacteriales archaeon]
MSDSSRIVIVGGGVIGCAVAHRLAPDHDVVVIEREQIAGEASGLAAGLVSPTLFYADHPAMAAHATAFFEQFDGTESFRLARRPRLELVAPDRESDARDRAERLAGIGFPVAFREPSTVEDRYPAFEMTDFVGAVEYRDTGWVDPHSLTVALETAASRRGVRFRTGETVTDLRVEDGRVTGVDTATDSYDASTVVAAAGWRTPDLFGEHVTLPVQPYRTQCLVLEPPAPLDDSFPLARVDAAGIYFRPEETGALLVGGGHDPEPTPETAATGIPADEAFRDRIADTLPEILPAFQEASVIEDWAGVDGGTPDNRPIIDRPSDGPAGLVVATGFSGLGIMTSPIAAAATRAVVTGESAPFDRRPFELDRFESRSPDFDLQELH